MPHSCQMPPGWASASASASGRLGGWLGLQVGAAINGLSPSRLRAPSAGQPPSRGLRSPVSLLSTMDALFGHSTHCLRSRRSSIELVEGLNSPACGRDDPACAEKRRSAVRTLKSLEHPPTLAGRTEAHA